MIPGVVSKLAETPLTASAAAIASPDSDVLRLTGTTTISNIAPNHNGGFGSILFVIPTTGAVPLTTGGNIAIAATLPQNKVSLLVWSRAAQLWFPMVSA